MPFVQRTARRGAVLLVTLGSLAACQGGAGGLGQVLGSVLGGGQGQAQGNQVAGTIAGVDTRNQQIGIKQQGGNGEAVGVGYDSKTRVIYQGQNYPVTALEAGDQVVARILDSGNGGYYTDSVHVTQSVTTTGGTSGGTTAGGSGSNNVQTIQGVVRQIDRNNGLFSLDVQGGTVTVSMPYNPRSNDVTRFQNLRAGETVRFAGVVLNNTRIELRQFY